MRLFCGGLIWPDQPEKLNATSSREMVVSLPCTPCQLRAFWAIYLDKQHHLQELLAGQNSSWKITDLTQLTDLFPINPLPSSFSLAGFIWSKNNLQEVVYVDGRSHIQELSSGPDNRWKTTDLTQRSNAPLAGSGAISGYDWTQMGSVQIVYRDRIGHIEELSSSQKDLWLQKDLTQASGLH